MSIIKRLERRNFLKLSCMAAAGTAFGTWSFRAKASLPRTAIRIGHMTDTRFGMQDSPKGSGKMNPGWLYGDSYKLAEDLVYQFAQAEGGKPEIILHSGDLLRTGGVKKRGKHNSTWEEWSKKSPIPFKVCGRGEAGQDYFSHDRSGFHIIQLDTRAHFSRLCDREKQLEWLSRDLAAHGSSPTILVLHPPLIETDITGGIANRDREALIDLIRMNPQVLLALCGKTLANRAGYIPQTRTMCLATASPAIYPCGARLVDIQVENRGSVTVRSWFLQTRRLDLVEKSFHQVWPPRLIGNLGSREDRSFTALSRSREIKRNTFELNPNLAPWWRTKDSLTLGVIADTHLCLDRFVSEDDAGEYSLIGHFAEAGSHAILKDVLEQAASGRHRVEFYDKVFSRESESNAHYIEQPVDALLIAGDLTEHGRRDEVEVIKAGLAGLPGRLRERTLVAIGNHDMWSKDFSPDGTASSRELISKSYNGYGISSGKTHYIVELTDWLALIVLDTVIASLSGMGMIQDQIDWLEDQVEALRDKVVLIASHHPLYHLTLVPPLMYGYLRMRSHFTPPRSAAREQLHRIFSRHNNVKMVICGHYHGVAVDQFRKSEPDGSYPDDAFTTNLQAPCTIEYPNGYRLLKISRKGDRGTIEYITAFTRRADLRMESGQAPLYKILGSKARAPRKYEGTLERLAKQENIMGIAASLNGYDAFDLNVRGFKDGTANRGRGNTGKPNINGKIEFTVNAK